MLLEQIIQGLPVALVQGRIDADINCIVEDSRQACKGCMFAARRGEKTDGRQFIADAIKAGAAAVLCDYAKSDAIGRIPQGVSILVTQDVPLAVAHIAHRLHGEPSKRLDVVGITGTNGKTTTAFLIHQILNAVEKRCGLIGTVQIDDGRTITPAELTTPAAIQINQLLAEMVRNGCSACVMETSSHALAQKRTAALDFKVAVFTNLTGDHLDFHKTMDAYFDAKAILFESLGEAAIAVINIDDQAGIEMLSRTSAPVLACTVVEGAKPQRKADCSVKIHRQWLGGFDATFTGPWGTIDCRLPLIGRHNAINALQAIASCFALGLTATEIHEGLAVCKAPPGRLEPVTSPDDPFAVLVDYAHTDDALQNVLQALRPVVNSCSGIAGKTKGKLRVVFGCGGDRDRTKRPRMAKVAARLADDVIITSDNPRTENPQSIVDEVAAGIPDDRLGAVMCIVDRERAIHVAVSRAKPGDIVLIAGKGHEDYQIIGTVKRPFDDRKVAAVALAATAQNTVQASIPGAISGATPGTIHGGVT